MVPIKFQNIIQVRVLKSSVIIKVQVNIEDIIAYKNSYSCTHTNPEGEDKDIG